MKTIDLNADIGEGFGFDERLMDLITSANVCCGEHAGSPALTFSTARACEIRSIRIGAHPGFPDRESFGRMPPIDLVSAPIWFDSVERQATSLAAYAKVEYLKPHGAWYGILTDQTSPWHTEAVRAVERICRQTGLPLMLLEGCPPKHLLERQGLELIKEGYVDRAYTADGVLKPRSAEGALIEEPKLAVEQALQLADRCDSLCVHGDSPNCVAILSAVREALEMRGWVISP